MATLPRCRWAPLDEAVGLRDRRMVKLLYGSQMAALKALHQAKRGDLLATMREMPDYTFKVGAAGQPDDILGFSEGTPVQGTSCLMLKMRRGVYTSGGAAAQLKWELGSPVLGLLLRRYAPHDTYEVGPHMHSSHLNQTKSAQAVMQCSALGAAALSCLPAVRFMTNLGGNHWRASKGFTFVSPHELPFLHY